MEAATNLEQSQTNQASEQSPPLSSQDEFRWTTVLASNIHCASCVTHIEDVLSRLGPGVLKVSVSIISDEVHIVHKSAIALHTLCKVLADEAFELYSATTKDKEGRVLAEQAFAPKAEGWLDSSKNRWWQPSQPSDSCLQVPSGAQRSRHLENCVICQAQQEESISRSKRPSKERGWLVSDSQGQMNMRSNYHETKIDIEKQGIELQESMPSLESSQEINVKHCPQDASKPYEKETKNSVKTERWKLLLSIGGMTCASCVVAITSAVKDLEQVETVSVDLMGNTAQVEFTGSEKLVDTIVETIEDIGYEAVVSEIVLRHEPSATKPKVLNASPKVLYRVAFIIGGMTCVACSNAITKGLEELPFVKTVSVTLLSHSGVVTFEDQSNLDAIVEKVEDLGYDCSVESCKLEAPSQLAGTETGTAEPRTMQIKIDGMFCEHCPPRVLDTLSSKFASSVTIDRPPTFKTPIMTITYQPQVPAFTIRDVLAAINATGDEFNASVFHPPSIEERSTKMQIHERNRLLQRLVLCAAVVIPTFLIGVVWMDLVPQTNSQRVYFTSRVWAGSVSRGEWAMFILATPVYFLAADVFHLRTMKEIRALWRRGSKVPVFRRFYRFGSMNLLISAGTSVAYISSLALLIINATSINGSSSSTTYFDSVVFLTFFILIGRLLEAVSKSKTGDAVSMLGKLRPQEAVLVVPIEDNGLDTKDSAELTSNRVVEADLLEIGDSVVVAHGSSPPADGVITVGQGNFDESSLTGESRGVTKDIGEKVFVGTINTGNPVTIKVTDVGGTSMLDQIVSVVREGLSKRAPVERLADVITGYFVPLISALAIITFVVWVALGYSGALNPIYVDNAAGGWAFWSLEFAIAVFVVACPCGIGLAAPTALFVGIGLAAKHGILVRGGGEAFQEAPHLDAIVFDKTGTLTEGGELKVTDHEIFDGEEEKMAWAIVGALEEQSTHPIAQAVVAFAAEKAKTFIESEAISEIPGMGMRGTFARRETDGDIPIKYEAALGSQVLIESLAPGIISKNIYATQQLSRWQNQSKSVAILALRPFSESASNSHSHPWKLSVCLATTDPIRPSALPTIQNLQARGIEVYILSGDNPTTAAAVGNSLGIPISNIFAGVLPAEKAAKIKYLQDTLPRRRSASGFLTRLLRKNHHSSSIPTPAKARIAFIGDGINDAPALQAATLSISLASGSPIAQSSSSFILLSPTQSLTSIPLLLDLSARVFRRVKFNYAWALVYNIVLVPVAAGVLFSVNGGGWRLGPVWAAAAMAGSSVSVVLSSLALRWESSSERGGFWGWLGRGERK